VKRACETVKLLSMSSESASQQTGTRITDWLRNRNTVEFLGIWESVFNPAFNYGEFAIIKN